MKKILSGLLALVSVICVAFAFVGCGEAEEKSEEINFYTVTEAYEEDLLTREQVMSIAYYHNGGMKFNEEIMGEDYAPLPKTPEVLSNETQNAIKHNYLDAYYNGKKKVKLTGVRIDSYYGIYNNRYVAVMASDDYSKTTDEEWTEKVDGISIGYNSGNRILIWLGYPYDIYKTEDYYTLKRAYEYGWLNVDDLKSIACGYYDSQNVKNPYKGLYEEPTEELNKEIEIKLKRIYLERTVKDPELPLDGVHIRRYYGTYNGNVVFSIVSDYICIDPIIDKKLYIGGVLFRNFWQGDIFVYHLS